jgi:hypothetical protein
MSQTRVYVPLTAEQCRSLSSGQELTAPVTAYAVTRALETSHRGLDEEEWEYLALQEAAGVALAPAGGRRAVVAAADVASESVGESATDASALSLVRVTEPIALRRIVSFHVTDPGASTPASGEDGSGGGEDDEVELSWYDATELAVLLNLL